MTSVESPAELLLHSSGTDGTPGELLNVTPASAGWDYTSLIVRRLAAGDTWTHATGPDEVALVPLGGTCRVTAGGDTWTIGGRASVFDGQPHALYLPRDSELTVTAESDLELAVCGARAERELEPVLIAPEDVA